MRRAIELQLVDLADKRNHDLLRYLILNGENVAGRPIVLHRPDLAAGSRVDQDARDAKLQRFPAQAAFQQVPGSKLTPDLLCIDVLTLVFEGRIRAMTKRFANLDRLVVRSSVIPSAK